VRSGRCREVLAAAPKRQSLNQGAQSGAHPATAQARLARNDIGRIAKTGSVKITEAFTVERYSHVMHIGMAREASQGPSADPRGGAG